ncbi:MAG TPA: L-threonylcarbamoyladenylate synthase [Verrucomicrobiae bacterium]|nr:L-threonylcarbamoyladenylate synthase [Verrucomicrobiae bacterium]
MSDVAHAAQLIRSGRLVAFPTETVYGLGANALEAAAVERIFTAKQRPHTSPLIVHVDSIEMAKRYAAEWPDTAQRLAARYWPGPLSLVVRKTADIPDIVTAGLPTVGLRMPDHPLALELIRASGVPIAAPSANRFTELSPSEAQHVPELLADFVLDGGPARVGIESTVLALFDRPTLLRPGVIPLPEIEAVIGPVVFGQADAGAHVSPGMHPRHYRPRTPFYLLANGEAAPAGRGRVINTSDDPRAYAARLYHTLHELDAQGLDWIAAEMPPDSPEWAGVRDRLQRAASERTGR